MGRWQTASAILAATPPAGAHPGHAMTQDHRYKEIQLAQLRSFCVAATEGNFTSAARALGLSASTVWQQVRALERELKARLLRRRGRAVELTGEGRALLEIIQPHVNGLDSLRRLFESRRADLPRELVLASGAFLFAYHLARPIRRFRESRPDVQLTLRASSWSALHRLIERGEADLAVLACDPDVPRSPYLEFEHLFEEQLTLMAPADHPLLRVRRLTPQEIVKHPLILPFKGGADRKAIDRLLRKHNVADKPRVAMVCGLLDVVKQCVLSGVGVALFYVTDEIKRGAPRLGLRPLEEEVERLAIEMAVRKGASLPDFVEHFRAFVRQCLPT
jgi:DNA-binding transcriptional LysR family regulator